MARSIVSNSSMMAVLKRDISYCSPCTKTYMEWEKKMLLLNDFCDGVPGTDNKVREAAMPHHMRWIQHFDKVAVLPVVHVGREGHHDNAAVSPNLLPALRQDLREAKARHE